MKKAIAILLSLTMILGLEACGNSASQTEQPSTEDTSVESKADTNSAESRTAEFEPESEATQPDDTEETEPAPETDTESEGTKVLVVYFSATNTTEGVAEHIANGLNADIYEIVPEDPYTDADLNYNDNNSRTTIEMNDPNARSLNRQDLVHVAVCKSALKFFADLREEIDVHLVIQKTVHLQHVGALDLPIFANPFLQKLHRPAATLSICKI